MPFYHTHDKVKKLHMSEELVYKIAYSLTEISVIVNKFGTEN